MIVLNIHIPYGFVTDCAPCLSTRSEQKDGQDGEERQHGLQLGQGKGRQLVFAKLHARPL